MENDELRHDFIDLQSVWFNFAEEEYPDDWDVGVVSGTERVDDRHYEPSSNEIYPLGRSFRIPEDFEEKLVNTTIIEVKGRLHLVSTGGGMNAGWDICETFVKLGYYPPACLCSLSDQGGRGRSVKDKTLVKHCNESLRIAGDWRSRAIEENKRRFLHRHSASPKHL